MLWGIAIKNRLVTKDDLPGIKKKPWRGKSVVKIYSIGNNQFFFPIYSKDQHIRSPDPMFGSIILPTPLGFTKYRGRNADVSLTTYLGESTKNDLSKIISNVGKVPQIIEYPFPIILGDLFENRNLPASGLDLEGTLECLNGMTVDEAFSIESTYTDLVESLPLFIASVRHNIFTHMRGIAPKKITSVEKHYFQVPQISSEVKFTPINPSRPDMVVKYGKGIWAGDCSIDIGLDFSFGCFANLMPSGTYDSSGRCSFCYAYQNGLSFLRTQFNLTHEYLKDAIVGKIKELKLDEQKRPIHIRLGQTTECLIPKKIREIPGFVDNLDIALDVIIDLKKEYNIRCVMPSHVVEYDKNYSKKFKLADLSLFASVDHDVLDPGMVAHGFTTEERLKGLLQYSNDGVNSNIYLAVDFVRGEEGFQKEAWTAIDFFRKNPKIGIQFLDVRITKRSDAITLGGKTWDELLYEGNHAPLFGDTTPDGGWYLTNQTHLAAKSMHPSIKKYMDEDKARARGCYVHAIIGSKGNVCGNCFMEKTTSRNLEENIQK